MSFDFPSQPQPRIKPRRGGCGRLIFMLVIAMAVYYMFSAGRGRKPVEPGGRQQPGDIVDFPRQGQPDDREDLKQDIFGSGDVSRDGAGQSQRQQQRQQMPSTGRSGADRDWQMDDVNSPQKSGGDFQNDSRLPARSNSNSNTRSKGDWSIDEVGKPKAEAEPIRRRTAPEKKSAKDDWSLDGVPTR